MAYNKDIEVSIPKLIKKLEKKEPEVELNRFDQRKGHSFFYVIKIINDTVLVVEEIKEREQWLKEMEDLGHGDKYRLIIEQQIQNKVREMQKMKTPDDL